MDATTTNCSVCLSGGREVVLRRATAGELRGVKMIDILQLDTAAHAVLIPRISDLTAAEFYALDMCDAFAIMGEVVSFLEPKGSLSLSALTTPGLSSLPLGAGPRAK